jgi:hypothetical protein
VRRLSPRLLAAAGVVAAGLVAVLVLHDHFVGDFTRSFNAVPRSYRAWHDPVALLCAFASVAVALRIVVGRFHRSGLALLVIGCTLAASVYVHQRDVHPFFCGPWDHCLAIMFRPDIWHDSLSLLILAVGFAAVVVVMLPRRWIATQRVRPQRG